MQRKSQARQTGRGGAGEYSSATEMPTPRARRAAAHARQARRPRACSCRGGQAQHSGAHSAQRRQQLPGRAGENMNAVLKRTELERVKSKVARQAAGEVRRRLAAGQPDGGAASVSKAARETQGSYRRLTRANAAAQACRHRGAARRSACAAAATRGARPAAAPRTRGGDPPRRSPKRRRHGQSPCAGHGARPRWRSCWTRSAWRAS